MQRMSKTMKIFIMYHYKDVWVGVNILRYGSDV